MNPAKQNLSGEDALGVVSETLRLEAEAVHELLARVDFKVARALELLLSCSGKVVVTGMGKSGIIGRKIAATFSSTGTLSVFLHPAEAVHGDLGVVSRGDVLLALSNSGTTEEVLRLLPAVRRIGVPIISLTGSLDSELAKRSEVSIDVGVEKEACPLNLAPTSSTTAALAMGDALAVALLKMRGFSAQDYAHFHPGGNLGTKLLTTVADLMETGEKMPVVLASQRIGEVVDEVLQKNFGVTSVIDETGALVGSFSAGDLLRLHIRDRETQFLEEPVEHHMNKNPKTVTESMLAAVALHDMEKSNIRALFVIDDCSRPVGIIGLYEVLKAIDY